MLSGSSDPILGNVRIRAGAERFGESATDSLRRPPVKPDARWRKYCVRGVYGRELSRSVRCTSIFRERYAARGVMKFRASRDGVPSGDGGGVSSNEIDGRMGKREWQS